MVSRVPAVTAVRRTTWTRAVGRRHPLLRKLWRDLWRNPASLAALLAIIAVGIAAFVTQRGAYRDLDRARSRYYETYRVSDFTVDLKRAPAWTAAELAKLPNVRDLRGRVSLATRVRLEREDELLSGILLSVPAQRTSVVNDVFLRSGTWFSGGSAREVILDDSFARAHDLRPGSRIRALLLDREHDLLVVGTASAPEFVYVLPPGGGLAPDPGRFAVLYVPDDFARESCGLRGAYNQLVGRTLDRSNAAVTETLRRVELALDPYGVTNATPYWEQPSTRFVSDELQGLDVSATLVPALFLGVAALVLNVLMGRIVVQERSIIGTLRALGYSRASVALHYVAFGAAVGLAGAALGMVLGWYLQVGLIGMYRRFFAIPGIEAHLHLGHFAVAAGISLLFAVLGTLKGAWRAATLEPAEAMRPAPPERLPGALAGRIGRASRFLSFRWKMVLRGVARNPFRSTVAVLAACVSTALVLATFALYDGLNFLVEFQFNRVARQDYSVTLREPRSDRAVGEMGLLPDVTQVEPQLSVVCDVTSGPRRKRIAVTGLPVDGRLYTPMDIRGRRVVAPAGGLVLDRKLAEVLGVGQGSIVRLRPLIGRRETVEVPVVAIVDSYFGLNAYAEIGTLNRLIGEEDSANVLLSRMGRPSATAPMLAALAERPSVIGLTERRRAIRLVDETFGRTMNTQIVLLIVFAGSIAFGNVLNAGVVSLSERRREVGTFRVLGYTPAQVGRIFSGESYVVNAAGIVLGLFAGAGLAHILSRAYDTELYRFPTIILPSRVALAAVIMAAFVWLAQALVQRMIRRLPWLEVLSVKE